MSKTKKLPPRDRVKTEDTWDLSRLYTSDALWQKDLRKLKKMTDGFAAFRGKLGDGPAVVAECLKFDTQFDRLAERLGSYAFLRATEDQANSTYQTMRGEFQAVAARAAEAPA